MTKESINNLLDVFKLIDPGIFGLEAYLFLHFTILGITVTLIALTTTLTKEVRQDLIWKHYLKTKLVIFYYGFIVLSFFMTLVYYFIDKQGISNFIFFTSLINFTYTVLFIPSFMRRLKRDWLYRKIEDKFKNEINKK